MDRWGLRRVILGGGGAAGGVGRADHPDAQPVAADAALGRAGRDRHRRHVDGAGGRRRDALVRGAARARARGAVGSQRDRPAGVPADARERRRAARLAHGDPDRGGRLGGRLRHRAACSCATGRRTSGCCATARSATDARSAPKPLAPLAALGHAVRSPAFWVLAGTFFVCGASTNGLIGTHLIAACHDYGIARGPVGSAAGGDGHLRHRRHDRVGLADRSLLEPAPAVRLLHAARAVAALPAVRAAARASTGSAGSRCSTASTGLPPFRRPCG